MSDNNWEFKKRFLRQENPSSDNLQFSYLDRLNFATITLALVHTLILVLIILLSLIPQLETETDRGRIILDRLKPVIVGCCIVVYDLFYASPKIKQKDLKNYGIDFVFFGLLASIFGWLVGIYLLVKGVIVMFISFTNSLLFTKSERKPFPVVFSSFMNKFASLLGFIILLLTNPFLIQPDSQIQYTYFYIALGVLLIDALILRVIINQYKITKVPFWIGILKLMFGVTACFYNFAGIMLVIEGAVILIAEIFRYELIQPIKKSFE